MPIAAKFSKEFYAKLGHGIADELVDWFNKVDTTYRSEFRELFTVNFARFDAKLEQRLVEIKAELREEMTKLEQRLVEAKAELREEMAKFEQRLVEVTAELRTEFRSGLAGLESRLIKWMFLFWVGTLGTVIALLKM
ncbi:MAG: hypothetical protein ACE5HT_01310 [Gemmatimonadales bacterium]